MNNIRKERERVGGERKTNKAEEKCKERNEE